MLATVTPKPAVAGTAVGAETPGASGATPLAAPATASPEAAPAPVPAPSAGAAASPAGSLGPLPPVVGWFTSGMGIGEGEGGATVGSGVTTTLGSSESSSRSSGVRLLPLSPCCCCEGSSAAAQVSGAGHSGLPRLGLSGGQKRAATTSPVAMLTQS
jgi:hypothetical protein